MDRRSMGSRSLNVFEDILKERRGTSDFMWMSREWHPIPAYQHVCKSSPHKLKQAVINSPRLQLVIEEVSAEQNVSKELLYKDVQSILEEVGQKRDVAIIRWLGLFLITMLKRCCSGILVNEPQVRKIKSIMGTTPTIFAPSHRSYLDFMLMSYICFHYDMQIPAIAAGMDFHSMWMVGQLMREACAFFMRRSFGSDRLYSTTFKEYVAKLVTDGDSALEFYIEGTRSRSAKSLMPKYGFLSMALAPFFTGYVPDVLIVPWSISYDRTPEEVLFAYELLGVPKPKESTSGLVKAVRVLDEQYGRVYVEVGEPISVRTWCAGRLERTRHALEPPALARTTAQEAALCAELALHLVRTQQNLCVVTCFNLVALAVNDKLLRMAPPVTLAEVVEEVAWLHTAMTAFGAMVALPGDVTEVEQAVKEAMTVHRCLLCLTQSDTIQLARVHHPGKVVDPSRLKGHCLSQQTMEVATPMMMLQHYVNPCLHYIASPAIVVLLMQQQLGQPKRMSRDELFTKYRFVRSILSHEFVLYSARESKDYEDTLTQLNLLNVIEVTTDGTVSLGKHQKLQLLLCHTLKPFLEGYLIVCQVVQEMAVVEPCPERTLIPAIQRKAESQLSAQRLAHPASLSLDMYSTALQGLAAMHALTRHNLNGKVCYQTNEACLHEVAHMLSTFMVQPQYPIDLKSWLSHEEQAKL